jgi:hypothetical protein
MAVRRSSPPGLTEAILKGVDLVSVQKWWISVQAKAAAISQPQA